MPNPTVSPELAAARAEIDAIDAEIHALLMKRASVVARIEAAKKVAPGRAAYRPAREADMMRRLVARHRGPFPLAAAEHIWREIITAFIRLQVPFGVHLAGEGADLRDLGRYQFGATTPLVVHADAGAAIAAVEARAVDLALVPLAAGGGGPWWDRLGHGPDPALVVARVPFLPGETSLPQAYVVGRVSLEPTGDDRTLVAVTGTVEDAPEALAARVPDGRPVAHRIVGATHHVLVSCPGLVEPVDLPAGARRVGGYAVPLRPE